MKFTSAPSRRAFARTVARLGAATLLSATLVLPTDATAQLQREAPKGLTDAEFWNFFTTMSEGGGTFASENFVSNEMTFQHVIPTLQRTLTPNGVYLGVGPEQNFTYIANLKPRMAVIFDIRRQNAMLHLMYKAIFEESPTRADFVARMFSRPLSVKAGTGAKAAELFEAAAAATASDSLYLENFKSIIKRLMTTHGFALSPTDIASIEHVYGVFFDAGPDINYSYRPGSRGTNFSTYPVYGTLQTATNADSVPMAFLATEENYRAVRDLHLRNLIVPVVGDFGGTKAIRAVGEYLRQRNMKVGAFYLSNVEQYLFQQAGAASRFYDNVGTLPIDSTSTFIRSVPGGFGSFGNSSFVISSGAVTMNGSGTVTMGNGTIISMSIVDSGGVRTIRLVQDSAGVRTTRVLQDSAGRVVTRPVDSTRVGALTGPDSLRARIGALNAARDSALMGLFPARQVRTMPTTRVTTGLLTSGLASIRQTLDAFSAGEIVRYQDIISMTRTSDWK